MSVAERAWLACAIDGEGAIGVGTTPPRRAARTKAFYVYLDITNTNEDFVRFAFDVARAGSVNSRAGTPIRGSESKRVWDWRVSSNAAADILRQIWPFLIIKQRQAGVALRLQNRVGSPLQRDEKGHALRRSPEELEARELLYREMRTLNGGRRYVGQ